MANASVYTSMPLSLQGSTNIRLMRLQPNNESTTPGLISCTLHVVPLDECPEYTAISYAWGEAGDDKIILVDGEPFSVRTNLWGLLDQLCKERCKESLWIDAICIDQSSNNERSHQVAMMGRIYSEAVGVLTWLGPATEGIARAMNQLPVLMSENKKIEFWEKQFVLDLKEIFSVEYWTRLWVLQEFVLAKNVLIRCGDFQLQEHILEWIGTNRYYVYRVDYPVNREIFGGPAWQIVLARASRQNDIWSPNQRWSCSNAWLVYSHGLQCTEVKDRIYGVLSLVAPEELWEHPIVPDYSKSVSTLFSEVVTRQLAFLVYSKSAECTSPEGRVRVRLQFSKKIQDILELADDDPTVMRMRRLIVSAR